MCGFAGVVGARRPADELEVLVGDMLAPIVSRGPDGSGIWSDPDVGVGLGHRRLSIVDLSDAGHQPMVSSDGRFVLSFNGEIYNVDDLAGRLDRAGVRRRGHSDTELFLETIAMDGLDAALDAADGMWAFALWDRSARVLSLCRDRLGEKPLVVARIGGMLAFGSTVACLETVPGFDRELSATALAALLRFGVVPAPLTIYSAATKVLPGHVMSVDATGATIAHRCYWSPTDVEARGRLEPFVGDHQAAAEHLAVLLHTSLRRRIVADVPVGALLSGGLDSSLIAAVAAEVSDGPISTFTIGQSAAEFDESAAARRVAAHLGARHHERMVSERDSLELVASINSAYDEPFGDSSQIPTMLVSAMAREHVTVVLGGDGGDELFGGYNRYNSVPSILRRSSSIPHRVLEPAVGLAARVPAGWWDRAVRPVPESRRPRLVGNKVAKVVAIAGCSDVDDAYRRVISHCARPDDLVPGAVLDGLHPLDPTRWPNSPDPAIRMMGADLLWYLPDDILVKVDRASMSVGLEARSPYLDRAVVEFALSLPRELRGGLRPKSLLRTLLADRVPPQLTERPKMGFGVPIGAWLRGPLRSWASDLLDTAADCDLLDASAIRPIWDEHQSGRHDRDAELWNVLSFLSWRSERR